MTKKNRLIEKWIDGEKILTNQYDRADNLTRIIMPKQNTYSFTYDESSRLVEFLEPGGYKLENTFEDNIESTSHGLRTSYQETDIRGTIRTTSFSSTYYHKRQTRDKGSLFVRPAWANSNG